MEETLLPPEKTQPSNIQFIEHLILQLSDCATSLANERNAESQLPFSTATPGLISRLKSLMLTLHCLFPNELLLALDILDRRLVRCFMTEGRSIKSPNATELSISSKSNLNYKQTPAEDMFFVISVSTAPKASTIAPLWVPLHPHADQTVYEVRLQAWNCTCPTFALATFRDLGSDLAGNDPSSDAIPQRPCASNMLYYPFGGSLTRQPAKWSSPVCKHLLACVLMVRCPALFGASENDRGRVVISIEELAGWCAGWGG
ncbi:hypothetical protein BDV28DRAFT_31919 [Aspergillus coremiiformis]|uniref:SWIM-type domain-containing protein n=1 Tax=Aspergillus coremiiformis TaxID=138285 RepID=A0A5N6YZD5_9EURO|nr:hypothetical protein BDV28DRAFT_31919 [Aspergillus coremiiformis]